MLTDLKNLQEIPLKSIKKGQIFSEKHLLNSAFFSNFVQLYW